MTVKITPANATRYLRHFGLSSRMDAVIVPSRHGCARKITVCHLFEQNQMHTYVAKGAAICAPSDTYDYDKGYDIALGRALGQFLKSRYGERPKAITESHGKAF